MGLGVQAQVGLLAWTNFVYSLEVSGNSHLLSQLGALSQEGATYKYMSFDWNGLGIYVPLK